MQIFIYIIYFISLFGWFIIMVATTVISLMRFYQDIDYYRYTLKM